MVDAKENKISYLVKYNKDKFILNIYENKYLEEKNNINQYKNYDYGDVLNIRAKIVIPEKLGNPYEFDYKRYLNSNNICGSITTYSVEKIYTSKKDIFSFIYSFKNYISDKIEKNLFDQEGQLLKSMLYSDDIFLDDEIKKNISLSGISHILTVSSGSIFCIFSLLQFIDRIFKKSTVKIIKIIMCIIVVLISNMEISIMRATIVIVIDLLFKEKIKLNKFVKLLISIYIILLINPYFIFNIGGIFSYLAIFSIVFFYSGVKSYFEFFIKKFLNFIKCKKNIFIKYFIKVLYKINSVFSLTLCITIFTFPVQVYFFNSFNFLTFITNLLVIPFISIIQGLGYLALICVYFFNISDILISASFLPLKCIIEITNILSKINLQVSIATPSLISIIFYYLIILSVIIRENIVKKFVLKNKILRIRIKFIIKILSFIFIIFILLEQIYIQNIEEYICFFNVKQGNMCIIRKNAQTVIIDMGSTTDKLASNVLNTFLKAKNIYKIDLVLLTHMHNDHINGIYDLEEKIKIKEVAYTQILHTINEEYNELSNFIESNKIKNSILKSGDIIKLNNLKISCLLPKENQKITSNDEINANGGVYLIEALKNDKAYKKILFMGDAVKESEEKLLENHRNMLENIDLLQVGHHGSKTSNSEELIKVVIPKISLISSYKKVYSHPAKETLDILNKYKSKIHITEINKVLKIKL